MVVLHLQERTTNRCLPCILSVHTHTIQLVNLVTTQPCVYMAFGVHCWLYLTNSDQWFPLLCDQDGNAWINASVRQYGFRFRLRGTRTYVQRHRLLRDDYISTVESAPFAPPYYGAGHTPRDVPIVELMSLESLTDCIHDAVIKKRMQRRLRRTEEGGYYHWRPFMRQNTIGVG